MCESDGVEVSGGGDCAGESVAGEVGVWYPSVDGIRALGLFYFCVVRKEVICNRTQIVLFVA